jgi:tight adherence protein B
MAAGAAALGLSVGGAGLGALAMLVAIGGPAALLVGGRHRGERRRDDALPVVLEAMARALRSGSSLLLAVEAATANAPPALADEWRGVAASARRFGVQSAVDGWARERPTPGIRLAAAALGLAAATGGASARAVDGVAATVRQRLAGAAEARALSAQARLSALVIAVAPVAFAGVAAATDPRLAHLLLRSRLGWCLLAAGLGLDAVGAVWMAAIARRVA